MQRLVTCLLVSNNACGKLVSSLDLLIMIDDNVKVAGALYFGANFNLSVCESNNFTFKSCYISVISNHNKIPQI